ncbi:hypothetical protein BT96DRAFT_39410 [Gymnopus androsaceus JB14]|uniref:Uncharacterized protein n=1 Tax=Gymnopus androsaceus JB14 TaxID=1447944 RepID=A0A6A4HMM9_9AGAR|nr:hypothetical protein BT96DRAFT_39410 [Gymnopus androsaceus JB14]
MSSSARIRLEHSMFSASTSQQTPTISDLLQDEFTLKILLEQLKALTKDSIIPLNEHRRILDDIYRMIDSTWTLANLEGYDIDNQSDRVQAWTLWRNIEYNHFSDYNDTK